MENTNYSQIPYNAVVIEFIGGAPITEKTHALYLELLNNNVDIHTIRLIIYFNSIKCQKDSDDLDCFLNNLPNSILNIDIVITMLDRAYGNNPFLKCINFYNPPVLLEKIFINNVRKLKIKKIPFGCDTIYTGHPNTDYDHSYFKQLLDCGNSINLRYDINEYNIFRGNVKPIN
jgi:hypothetical protein